MPQHFLDICPRGHLMPLKAMGCPFCTRDILEQLYALPDAVDCPPQERSKED